MSHSAASGGTHASTSERVAGFRASIPSWERSLRSDGDADNGHDIDGNGDTDTVDKDDDSHTPVSHRFPDADDTTAFGYGEAADTRDSRALASIVRHYYAAAHANEGSIACSLMQPAFARGIPATYGPGVGMSHVRRGETCQSVMTGFFRRLHHQIPARITVVAARVEGQNAQVIIASRSAPASEIALLRYGASWTVAQILGVPLP